jgi:3-deoxy-D-manno-octulosonate 8-phosphate phosphatase (KDO 8-P phosphatase)
MKGPTLGIIAALGSLFSSEMPVGVTTAAKGPAVIGRGAGGPPRPSAVIPRWSPTETRLFWEPFALLVPHDKLLPIRLLAMDVDGVLTDGTITWAVLPGGGEAFETKSFHVQDGLAFSVAQGSELRVAWITGRRSAVVERRAQELGVGAVYQGARDKAAVLAAIVAREGLATEEVAFLGDDLNDLPAFQIAGLRIAVGDAAPELVALADWVAQRPGGRGAVREVVEGILRAQGRWEAAVARYLSRLRDEQEGRVGQ